jgi:hypothetical protein
MAIVHYRVVQAPNKTRMCITVGGNNVVCGSARAERGYKQADRRFDYRWSATGAYLNNRVSGTSVQIRSFGG